MKRKQLTRVQFREKVFKRDRHECRFCDECVELVVHQITELDEIPNEYFIAENGISLCPDHQVEAEVYHISRGKRWVKGMHPDDLYAIIDSSHDLVLEIANSE